jgi:hypothetical protein
MALVSYTSLNGSKSMVNMSCLSGGTFKSHERNDINKIRYKVLNELVIPFLNKKWDKMTENMMATSKIKKQLTVYQELYKSDEVVLLKSLFDSFEVVLQEHEKLTKYEKAENTMLGGDKKIAQLVYEIPALKIKPEYEIYNYILGKPNQKRQETYNIHIIDDINKLLELDDIEFNAIVMFIKKKYRIAS